MENERKRILQLVENGTITADEAIVLLEAMSKEKESTPSNVVSSTTSDKETSTENTSQEQTSQNNQTTNENTESKTSGFEDIFGKAFNNKEANKKMDEFMNDLKHDLSQFSNRVMSLMNTTFTKIKDFDFEFPFGDKVEFNKTYTYNTDDVKGIELEIPNGRIEISKSEDNQFLVEAHVKTSLVNNNEENTIEQFEKEFVKLQEGQLNISTSQKMSQITLHLFVPEKEYDVVGLRLLNGSVKINHLNTKLLKVKTYNGAVTVDNTTFSNADIQSGNGAIELVRIQGEDLEAETVNGRIYIDGHLQEIEAESVNGAVVVTTHAPNARKIKARTVAGAVELYIPKTVSLDGEVTTNFGKTDVGLSDVVTNSEEDQFLLKTLQFKKMVENTNILKLIGESRTGSIVVRYVSQL